MLPSWRNCHLKLAKVEVIQGHQKKRGSPVNMNLLNIYMFSREYEFIEYLHAFHYYYTKFVFLYLFNINYLHIYIFT
jgi:hypothetical protein